MENNETATRNGPADRSAVEGAGPARGAARYGDFRLADLTAVRNLLRGGSVIDWHRLYFESRDQVDRFLRVNEFDPESRADLDHLEDLRERAVEYLERHLGFRIDEEVAERVPAPDLLLLASHKGKKRVHACVVLKVMHVLQHLEGRSLLTNLPVSAEQIFHLIEEKALHTVEEMKQAGCSIVEFEWSRKHADSLITKLLAKRETIAADIYDRLRFRTIAQTREELIFVLRELVHRLIPFNYVIPGQSVNGIVDLRQIVEGRPELRPYLAELMDLSRVAGDKRDQAVNEFSGPGYKIINLVADLPVRIDKFISRPPGDQLFAEKGAVVYVLAEFQIVDAGTAAENEIGENSHEKYKERQAVRVRARLMHGMKEEE